MTKNFEELVLLTLDANALRTLLALRHLSLEDGSVNASMDDLGILTGYSRPTLSRAVSALKDVGLLEVVRSKRNLGKLSYNKYQLLPCIKSETLSSEPCIKNETSTTGTSSNDSYTGTSTYMYDLDSQVKKYREVTVANEKWRPRGEDVAGDDEVGGVGLFEDEKPAVVKHKLSVDKRDPKTRGRRPEHEWTPADVAVEFSYLLTRKYPYLPGTFKTSPLRGALAGNRNKYGFTAIIELELLRMFMGDSRNHHDAEKQPEMLYKRYLKMFFTDDMNKAHVNLGLPSRKELYEDVSVEENAEFVYASDGREFDNSITGRKALERYEEKLKVTNG
jgi:hypothetical protein